MGSSTMPSWWRTWVWSHCKSDINHVQFTSLYLSWLGCKEGLYNFANVCFLSFSSFSITHLMSRVEMCLTFSNRCLLVVSFGLESSEYLWNPPVLSSTHSFFIWISLKVVFCLFLFCFALEHSGKFVASPRGQWCLPCCVICVTVTWRTPSSATSQRKEGMCVTHTRAHTYTLSLGSDSFNSFILFCIWSYQQWFIALKFIWPVIVSC